MNQAEVVTQKKPLGRKNYGHIPHLPGSRMGPGDHKCHEGQARIATEKARDKNDEVFVQEKLDGSNVGVARIGDVIWPLGRAGRPAGSSPWQQHRHFHYWAHENRERFMTVLQDGERLVGEWLMQAHSTRYELPHEPFVAFDLMTGDVRTPYDEFLARLDGHFFIPELLHCGEPLSIGEAMHCLKVYGAHGATDPVEGAIWRVERDKPTGEKGNKKRVVDFLVKYVRPDKVDGLYLPDISGEEIVWNSYPAGFSAETGRGGVGRMSKRELLVRLTKKDFEIQTFKAGGKGGQHQNKTDSGVRIIHKASDARGESRSERSQLTNKKLAFQRLTKSPKFKVWLSEAILELDTGKTIEQRVEEQMKPENIKIEIVEDGKWQEEAKSE